MSIGDLPPVLTVPEAGALLRISRTAAFEQARLFRQTGGAEGIPNYRIGRSLRVPTEEFCRRFGLLAA